MPTALFDAALRGAVMALLLLLAALLQRQRSHLPVARLAQALCALLCVQIVSSTPAFEAQVPRLWQAPLVGIAVANAVLFWVFVQALFDDAFGLRPLHGVAWTAAFALGTWTCSQGPVLGPGWWALQRAVPLVFVVLAIWAAAAQWRADLVEGRRRLRAFVVAGGCVYTLAQLGLRVAAPQGRLSGSAAGADMLMLLGVVAGVAWLLLRVVDGELFAVTPAAPASPLVPVEATSAAPDEAQTRLAAALHQRMSEQHAYRDETLSVASLAGLLDVPEYRLRKLINQGLGQRNFNAYVNSFRLVEARAILADPQWRERSVLTVALDAGFASIGPFNRAFKAATGQTPSDYRRQKLADPRVGPATAR